MESPQSIPITSLKFYIMKKSLKISKASSVLNMSGCSKGTEGACGIQYRMG